MGCFLLMAIAKFAIISFSSLLDIEATQRSLSAIEYMRSSYPFLEAFILGLAFGIVFILNNNVSNRIKKLRKLSFGKIILLKSILFFTGIISTMFVLFLMGNTVDFYPIQDIKGIINEPHYKLFNVTIICYFGGMSLLLNFLLILARKFGISDLMNLITGKYNSPKEENRIFLFMDLKSSTRYGEQLDHYKYSRLLRDCFTELNELVPKYSAEIYQYVGDEVVLTWDFDKSKHHSYPIDLFFSFQERLKEKEQYFQEKYGILPVFKAGAHGGKVTVTEIGDLKRELAYHGDAINTASRIQGACNQYNAQYLVSESLMDNITQLNGYSKTSLGNIKLKGKANNLEVFSIDHA